MARWLIIFIFLPSWVLSQDLLLKRAVSLKYSDPDSAIVLCEQVIAQHTEDTLLIAEASHHLSVAHWVKGEYKNALAAAYQGLSFFSTMHSDTGMAKMHNDLGLSFWKLKDEKKSMEHYLLSLELAESSGHQPTRARALGNIGILYEEQNNPSKALEFHSQCLNLAQEQKDHRLLANTLNNIALIYKAMPELEKAENFAKRSLKIRRAQNDLAGQAQALNLLGTIQSQRNEYALADSLYQEALQLYEKLDDAWGRAAVLGNIGADANANGNFQVAIIYCDQAYQLSRKFKLEWELPSCRCLGQAYLGLNDNDNAIYFWKRSDALKDSIHARELRNDISLLEQRFEHEKDQLQFETELKHQEELSASEIERQLLLRNASLGIGTLALALFFVLFFNYRGKQKQNELLERQNAEISYQKEIIEEKNKHITDSIRYAERLQDGILPKWDAFRVHFKNHHVFYKPKDIVSGDFYWLEESDGRVFIAVADCTGHGVPGAMVSMVGVQGLNKAVLEEGLIKASDILQRLSDHVEEVFEKSRGSVRDGMDIALCIIGRERKRVNYAGAHNSVLIATRNKLKNGIERESLNGLNLYEFKADRRSIGGYFDAGPFTDQEFDIAVGDTIFLFSDGYADQFGGMKNKKIGSRQMREFLLAAAVNDELTNIDQQFKNWKSSQEQIDDVTVIAIRI